MDLDLKGEWVLRNGIHATVVDKYKDKRSWAGFYTDGTFYKDLSPSGEKMLNRFIHEWNYAGNSTTDEKFDLMTRRRGEEQWNS